MASKVKLQILGFGPAAVGIFVATDRLGVLGTLLEQGVYIYEKHADVNEWNSLEYKIPSNSPIGDFLCGIRKDGVFAEVMQSPRIRQWLERRDDSICLTAISGFLKELMLCVVKAVEKSPTSRIFWSSPVSELYMHETEGFGIAREGETLMTSDSLVLATGARNRDMPELIPNAFGTISSDSVLRCREDDRIRAVIHSGCPIVIFGGSHSGFSSAGYLLSEFGAQLSEQQIHVVSKDKVVQMYSPEEVVGTELSQGDVVNPMTREINKFHGLRRDARALYRSVLEGDERRIKLYELENDDVPVADRLALNGSGTPLVINATGYEPRIPKLFDLKSKEICLDRTSSNICKDPFSGELLCGGKAIPKLYATGLGFADNGVDGAQVGINFFHNQTAQRIVENLMNIA
ncbi:hypothetical protein [Hahella ganghwensis]|uniref:hypothetical protein n=1 Tax=Hahella ganghwensis TaxID=286420 RepID=UPI000380C71B|nr:hypothetical protein [Hahella ganghwensis]